jgi:hypothetical protein
MANWIVALSVIEAVSRPMPKVFATLLVLVKAETFTVGDSCKSNKPSSTGSSCTSVLIEKVFLSHASIESLLNCHCHSFFRNRSLSGSHSSLLVRVMNLKISISLVLGHLVGDVEIIPLRVNRITRSSLTI